MSAGTELEPAFVIKAQDILAINYLANDHPRPRRVEWINRGTNQVMRPTTTQMLLRTLFQDVETPSVQKLRETSGLRVVLRSERDRELFSSAFADAQQLEGESRPHVVTAVFDGKVKVDRALSELDACGATASSISLLCRASQFMDTGTKWPEGHSKRSVAGAVAGSGFAGAMLGIGFLMVPGVGPLAAGGALATSAISSVASVSGIIAATGGAIAKMLTDHDVDGVSASFYDTEIKRGKIFVSVDTCRANLGRDKVMEIFSRHGGQTAVSR
ncbi:MAG: hypothetical protein EP350_03740 [Alphaproteobacteria bacterium]|nr:MAG: hypothetical protein EP350_03740 [Alphaproteobacteria bacterium]